MEIASYIDDLNLDFIAVKMASKDYTLPRWPLEEAKKLITSYKHFLKLLYKYPDMNLIPTKEIAECWQQHILYTRHYHHSCEQIFGKYYHYTLPNPACSPEDMSKLIAGYKLTQELYFDEYQREMFYKYSLNSRK